MDPEDASAIGARARKIRTRRGLSLDVAAGLAGISKGYLSMLEHGQRGFNRRGLIEDLADALGCSVVDLTGQPYLPPDRESALAKTVIAQIERGLNEATLDDVPDLQPRPLDALDDWARSAVELRDTASYRSSGEGIDDVLIELQVHLATIDGRERLRAAGLLTQTAYHAFVLATTFGYMHLAQVAAQRSFEAARISERPELEAFAMFARAPSVARTGGRQRAVRMLDRALDDAQQLTAIRDGDTLGAETFGLLHLMGAHFAARDSDAAAAADRLDEASRIALLTGERNGLQQHFGPTNVNVWRVAVGAELGQGPAVAERVEREPIDLNTLGSKDRIAALHFDLARSWAQAEGDRDNEAIRHLDTADRIAPTRIRNDPIARDLVLTLDRRARRRVWELDSLRNRFGVGGQGRPRSVNN
ncbi:MAG TPA: helix-turn-helix transcriptional regulator [Pseudonocardiaceae bacterium]|nr:helix-turn-helix transcriptional regulator [Pseudonocardiaceae bacterium]